MQRPPQSPSQRHGKRASIAPSIEAATSRTAPGWFMRKTPLDQDIRHQHVWIAVLSKRTIAACVGVPESICGVRICRGEAYYRGRLGNTSRSSAVSSCACAVGRIPSSRRGIRPCRFRQLRRHSCQTENLGVPTCRPMRHRLGRAWQNSVSSFGCSWRLSAGTRMRLRRTLKEFGRRTPVNATRCS
jgi:hypothetical protein